jgi:acetyltransferase-like isoleucine patch superfamily enzyme
MARCRGGNGARVNSNVREIVKGGARFAATLAVAPLLVSYWIRGAFLGKDRALEASTETLSLVPGIVGQYLRRAFLARTIARCAPSATIGFGTLFSQCGARIDEHVYIGPRCHLGLVHLERDVLLAAGVHIPSGPHTHGIDLSMPVREQPGDKRLIRVGAGSWIGSAAIVLADVGRDTILGAGSVVTRPLPDRVIAAGVPARVVRSRVSLDTQSA